ncbi:MAG: exonuclease domain-containing protein [Steroidobacteraceae bacterium]
MAAAEIEALPTDLVFVDLETTGGNAAFHRITEIAIVRLRNGELAEQWSSLVNPGCPIPAYIEDFTGISDAMVAGAPRFADIAAQVRQKLQGAVFVAHNARFDYSFLRSEFRRLGTAFFAEVLCTVKLSRRLFPEHVRHNLDAVMERHGLSCSARHRALGDAQVLRDFWFALGREVPQAALGAAVHALLGAHKLPAHLPADFTDDLPDAPGAYRLYGEGGALLYVGKSLSLRSRVLAQLAGGDAESGRRRLIPLVRRLDWVQTAGELGAALLEAQWIKTQTPLYNRHGRRDSPPHTLRPAAAPHAGGSARPVEAIPFDVIDAAQLEHCFGVFRSAKDARKALADIARARQLCLKVLGFEEGAGSCLAYQMGKCKGACVGQEPLMLHDLRLRLALSSLKLKAWPFPGRIALRERGPRGHEFQDARGEDLHVIDRWRYLGTARSEEELAELRARPGCAGFDVDVYKILTRHFSNHPKLDWIDLRDARDAAAGEP